MAAFCILHEFGINIDAKRIRPRAGDAEAFQKAQYPKTPQKGQDYGSHFDTNLGIQKSMQTHMEI